MTLLPALTLWRRETVRFLRQPNRVVGAIGSPLLFWFLLGSSVGGSYRPVATDESYFVYFFPGTLVLILLFTAIFSTISIIEDRREGFLQSVLVAPVSRATIVLGKVLGGAFLAFLQALLFLILAFFVGIRPGPVALLEVAGVLWLLALGLTSLGFVIAWRMQSTQGFHAIMNFLLLPMWLLSGALFPVSGAMGWMQWVMRLNPLTYGVNAVRLVLVGGPPPPGLPGLGVSLLVMMFFVVLAFGAATFVARGTTRGDLQ
jgi:ABC-2 type transport system permease protein